MAERVEIPAHADAWMRGDRYGEVVARSGGTVKVKMDKSGKTLRFNEDDVKSV
jgi:hypothetical protein